MRNCFVPGCDRKNKNGPKRAMFTAPKDKNLLKLWTEALPKLRTLKVGDTVCNLHFHSHEVQKTFEHIINGEIFHLERDRPRLKANAVPSANLPNTAELEIINNRRKKGKQCDEESVSHDTTNHLLSSELGFIKLEIEESDEVESQAVAAPVSTMPPLVAIDYGDICFAKSLRRPTSIDEAFSRLYDNVDKIALPNSLWGLHRCPQRSMILFSYVDIQKMMPTKMLTVDCYGTVRTYLLSNLITTVNIQQDALTTEALTDLLYHLEGLQIYFSQSAADCDTTIKNKKCADPCQNFVSQSTVDALTPVNDKLCVLNKID